MKIDNDEALLDEDMRHTSRVLALINSDPKSAADVVLFELSSAITLAHMHDVDVPREVAKLLAQFPTRAPMKKEVGLG